MEFSIRDYEMYLLENYADFAVDTNMFMKMVEEVGEVAEVLNKRDGRKAKEDMDIKAELGNELVDVIHYAVAIAALNGIDLNNAIISKDRKAAVKYQHDRNFEEFLRANRNSGK